jgi:hypothetical protein
MATDIVKSWIQNELKLSKVTIYSLLTHNRPLTLLKLILLMAFYLGKF